MRRQGRSGDGSVGRGPAELSNPLLFWVTPRHHSNSYRKTVVIGTITRPDAASGVLVLVRSSVRILSSMAVVPHSHGLSSAAMASFMIVSHFGEQNESVGSYPPSTCDLSMQM